MIIELLPTKDTTSILMTTKTRGQKSSSNEIFKHIKKSSSLTPCKNFYLENFLHLTKNMLMKTTVKNRSANSASNIYHMNALV